MQAINCVVVGDKGVGKTCMLISHTTGAFPGEYVPDVMDDYQANVMVDHRPYNLSLRDTSGPEDLTKLPHTDLFLICFAINKRDSFTNITSKWVPEIKRYFPKAPFIILGLVIDLRDAASGEYSTPNRQELGPDPVTFEEGEAKANEIGAAKYVECSAWTQLGLKRVLNDEIVKAVNDAHRNVTAKKKNCIVQ